MEGDLVSAMHNALNQKQGPIRTFTINRSVSNSIEKARVRVLIDGLISPMSVISLLPDARSGVTSTGIEGV